MMLNGLGVSGLFLLAWRLGNRGVTGVVCGLNALVMWGSHWFYGYLYANRLTGMPALRENWALPFLFFQIAALCSYLRQSSDPTASPSSSRASLCAWTALSVLAWQFSQFLLWLQLLALLCVYVVGWVTLARVRASTHWILLGVGIATVVSVGVVRGHCVGG